MAAKYVTGEGWDAIEVGDYMERNFEDILRVQGRCPV